MRKTVLAIDPSLRNLGYAFFQVKRGTAGFRGKLITQGLIRQPTNRSVSKRIRRSLEHMRFRSAKMVNNVLAMLYVPEIELPCVPDYVVIEMPVIYSRGSAAARAARNSGALTKLIYFVGSLTQALIDRECSTDDSKTRPVLVTPATWKGQVKKHITHKRMIRRYGRVCDDLNHNIIDAIGIGTWFIERRLRYQ
jgi:Holliday junction resolvasome RuvABC endonuclease subunit